MQLIIIILMFSSGYCQYLRDLYDHGDDYGFGDMNKLSSINQRKPNYINVKPESCTSSKCRVKLSETFNMVVDKGYGVSMKLTHTGLMNTTIDFFIKNTNFNITPNYLYTTPMTKIYYRIYFKNYDSKKYDNCVNGVGDDDFTTIADVMISGTRGKDWEYANRKSKTFEIGPLSADAIKCGHYWPTTLSTCVEKAVIVRLDRGISTYKLDNEVELDFTISALIDNKEFNYKFQGDFNQPQVWQIKDNLALEVNPMGTTISPLNSYMSCLFKFVGDKSNTKCYLSNTVPDKGSISNTGIGKFQLISFNNPEKLLFDKSQLIGDLLYPCSDSNYRVAKVRGYGGNEFRAKVFELYNLKKSDHQEDKVVIDFLTNTSSASGFTMGDTCCVKVISPTDLFLENAVSSLEDIRETYKQKMLMNVSDVKLSSSGIPKMDDLNFLRLEKPTILVSLLSDGLDIGFDSREFELKNLKVPKMVYFQSAAGSYFSLSFEYIGQPQNIKIDSKEVNVLTKELFIHKSGLVDEMVGFKSIGYLKGKPSICIGSNDYCVTPDEIEYKQPKDGMVDDNEIDDKEYIDRGKDFFWKLFSSNWYLSGLSTILAIIEIISTLVVATMIYKVTRKFFTVFCCAAAMKESNAFITSRLASGLQGELLQEIDEYYINGNVGTIYGLSTESSLINMITNSDKGLNYLTCASYNPSVIKEHRCDDYCLISPFKRELTISKRDGSKVLGGDIWSSNVADLKMDGKTMVLGLIENLFENKTVAGDSDCKAMWETAKGGQLVWIKETVLSGYVNKFGISTVKLLSKVDSKTSYIFEFLDHVTAYDGYDVIDIQKFGRTGQIHAVAITIVSDGSLDVDDRMDDLKKAINLPNEAIVHTIKNNPGNYIMRSYFLIQCEERCVITDPTSEGKSKEITITKYKPIIDNDSIKRKTMNKLIDICKKIKDVESASEEHMVDEVSLVKNGNKTTHFIFKNRLNTFIMPIKHLNNIFDSSCNYKVKFNNVFKNGYHHSNFLVDNNNVYEVSRGGPIAINCINTGHGSRCKHLNNEMTAFINEDSTNELDLRKIKYKGMVYSYAIGDYIEHISPMTDTCTGKVMVDSLSNAICSHDCCLVSDSYWQKFVLFKSNDKYSLKDTAVFSQWKDNKKLTYNLKGTNWCDYTGFYNSMKCLWQDHWIEVIVFLCTPFITITIYYIILAIYYTIIWCWSANPRRDSKYIRTKRYNKRWFFSNMADNILKGKPKFWKYDRVEDNDVEYYNDIASRPVYRRTVKPAI